MNKRILFAIFAIALCLPVWSQMRGDFNGDGIVDVSDVSICIDMVLGKAEPNLALGDFDGNGIIDVSDVSYLIDIVLGKIPSGGDDPDENTFTVNGVTFKMVPVEGGTFSMGATSEQGLDHADDELPTHHVTLSGFSIGETEVTQELWVAVMGSNPSYFSENNGYTTNLQRPVERVSWDDCQEFITKLNELTGKTFRLPTEAEWEYAARGGNKSQHYKYAGSNSVGEVAWYESNAYLVGENSPNYGTNSVATKKPNELGLYDMSGNVWEWCQDWYSTYSSEAQTNPTGPSTGYYRVGRGGCWRRVAGNSRLPRREKWYPHIKDYGIGFRLAL